MIEPNVFEALRDATRESALLSTKVRELIRSVNRHGDLQVARSAALRVIDSLDRMIAYEAAPAVAYDPMLSGARHPVSRHQVGHQGELREENSELRIQNAPPAPRRQAPHHAVARERPRPAPPTPPPPPAAQQSGYGANGRHPSGTQAALLKHIERSPGKHTSGDLAHLTGLNPGTVYTALATLKKTGRIYTQKDDDGDGQSKWHSSQEGI
jgi:IclR helix-turn-helix domain